MTDVLRQPEKKARPKKSEITRAAILDAAAYVLRTKGYALARLGDIAKRARTQPSSIYYYFESREAIVAEVLRIANERTNAAVLEALAAVPAEASARDKITAVMTGHLTLVLSGDPYTSAHIRIFAQLPPKLRKHFIKVMDENSDVWRGLFEAARRENVIRPDFNLSVLRLQVLGMLNWSIEWYMPGGMTPQEIARQAATLLFDGAGVPPARPGD